MSSTAQEEYDRVLYPGEAHPQTHPDRLATLAALFGMRPAPIEHCRVLEIGCTDGGNLIPMAYTLPGSEFVGIDISARSLAAGRECIAALGLSNIQLVELDILRVPPDFGTFDYIIAHGVYSWVPAEVREKTLALCRAHLAPEGVAYISYNAYPGGHFREIVRGMMLYHVREARDPEQKRKHAADLLRFVVEGQPGETLFGKVVAAELERIDEYTEAAFYHDDLAETRTPFYFHEFVAQAAEYGLQFLSEAAIYEMEERAFAPSIVEALHAMAGDRIAREQYLDFLRGRRFRQTLICHREVSVDGPLAAVVPRFFISSQAKPVSAIPQLDESAVEEFLVPVEGGARLKTAHSLAKAAVLHLGKIWPQAVAFDELVAAARSRLGARGAAYTGDGATKDAADALLAMYSAGLVQFHSHVPQFTTKPGARPIASPVVRWALARGARSITNLRHVSIPCGDPIAAQMTLLLDGTRDRDALASELATFCHARDLLSGAGKPQSGNLARLRDMIAAGLEENLGKLARMAVLIG